MEQTEKNKELAAIAEKLMELQKKDTSIYIIA